MLKLCTYRISAICLFLFACWLFFFRIGYHSLWSDELLTVQKVTTQSQFEIWNTQDVDTHDQHLFGYMSPYFSVLKINFLLFGDSEAALRSLSAFSAVVALGMILIFGPSILELGYATSLSAGLIFTLSPMMLWYAQEARYYAFLQPLAFALCACYQRFWKTNRPAWLVAWSLFSILAIMAHPYMFFLITAISFWGIWEWRKVQWKQKSWIIITHSTVMGYFSYILRALLKSYERISSTEHIAYTLYTDELMPWKVLSNFLCGVYEHGSVILASFLLVTTTGLLVIHSRAISQYPEKAERTKINAFFWIAAFLGGCALMIMVSWFRPIMVEGKRYVMVFFTPFCICLANALTEIFLPRITILLFFGVMALNTMLVDWAYFTDPQKQNWRLAGEIIQRNAQDGDVWIHQNTGRRFAAEYYAKNLPLDFVHITLEPSQLKAPISNAVKEAKRVWIIKTGAIVDSYGQRLEEEGFQCVVERKLPSGSHFMTVLLLYEHK